MTPTPVQAVARVAYLASDVLVDSQPPRPAASAFSNTFAALTNASHQPRVVLVPFGADAGAVIQRNASTNLVSFTATSSTQVLTRLILHLSELAASPLVLHVAIQDDLTDVLLLRPAVPFFLLSSTLQQAHDNALLASRLARTAKQPVIHAFYKSVSDDSLVEIAQSEIAPFIYAPPPKILENGHSTQHTNSVPNDIKDGHANGHTGSIGDSTEALFHIYESVALEVLALTKRPLHAISHRGSPEPHTLLFLLGRDNISLQADGVGFVLPSLIKPLPGSRLVANIPSSVSRVIVLEQVHRWSTKWTPLYLEIVNTLQQHAPDFQVAINTAELGDLGQINAATLTKFVQGAANAPVSTRLQLGSIAPPSPAASPSAAAVPKHEYAYTKILSHLFNERLDIVNSPALTATQGAAATSPEFALGRARAHLERRAELIAAVKELLLSGAADSELHVLLSKWVAGKDDTLKSRTLGDNIVRHLEATPSQHSAAQRILSLKSHFPVLSRWIIGSDAWSYDLGSSGLHHAIASGFDINILIIDSTPYTARSSADPHRRKQDVGLYAMNYGNVFVASVAVYSSYSQVLQALVEADRYQGPSVVLAYLPYHDENAPALELLKETKLAVDAGYWPLYRWDPSKEAQGKEPFSLDSDAIKNELKQFLDRQNHLSQLVRSKPEIASEIVSSLGESIKEARRNKAKKAFNDLLTNLDAPPLLVLYASDGGAAEKVAKRLANRGKARGLSVTVAALDTVPLESLAKEEYVAFVTSVAGQGEPPQNGRNFFKTLNAAVAKGESFLSKLKYSVFGMGDSHYWPRPEDAQYYNKAGKDLNARLQKLGAEPFVPLGLGDDQDADGPQTGYQLWEPLVWKALGVDSVEVTEAEPDPITNEHIKAASQYLRGTIAEGLADDSTGALAASDTQLTKFHGIYQQDDRDIRDERQAQGVEPAYSFMIRVRMPGGVCTPTQWLQMDQIASEHGSGTFKITTRQTFQFHGVIKRHLKSAIQDINRVLLDTLAACGDVNRNVICSSIPTLSKLHAQVYEIAKTVSSHLIPRTTAYHEIWLDKKMVAGDAVKDFEPLYGEFYLPRKFKIAIAVPPTNDVDVFANDLGYIAIVAEDGTLSGFNVTAGGGMGVTHGNKKTYPRIGDILGFCTPEQAKYVAEAVMLTQRDNGNRADRKNARLKYTIDRMGLDVFKAEVEKRLGFSLQLARPYSFDRNIDDFGWHTGEDGKHHFTMFIENGRIQDEPGRDFKIGLREIAKIHKGTFRLTANQHLLISDIDTQDLPQIKDLLAKYKMDNLSHSGLRLSSSACVAFPTCGLAMAESERYLPILIDKVEKICETSGLRNDSIVMRMTGCPNGCARPYLAEVAFVGKAPGTYSMLLGGGYYGQRINKIYRETVTEPEILAILEPMIKRYALERREGERFGDWTIRAGYISPTTSGKEWYEGMGGEGQWREVAI
ncbi:hypothetical protein AX16_001427 [Volvariella volvacea WC 439]|nr:hypothetical protein AX16_001427 [Volvariella volvacea WC 439]